MDDELEFWREFIKTDRFLNNWCSHVTNPELCLDVRDFIISNLGDGDRVLDCGSGVVSILHGAVPSERLVSADLLADRYAEVFDYSAHGIERPIAIACEDMAFDCEFGIVHISNALDHCRDPLVSYCRLTAAVKPGGYLIIQGFENEGFHEAYHGMHQWNIRVTGNGLFVSDRNGVGAALEANVVFCKVVVPEWKPWIIWIARKPA